MESDLRARMQPLKEQLINTISHVHGIFETAVFIAICRGYWDRMGQVSSLVCLTKLQISGYQLFLINVLGLYLVSTGNFKFLGEQKRE